MKDERDAQGDFIDPTPTRARSGAYFVGMALLSIGMATAQVAGAVGTASEGIDASGDFRSEMRACQSGDNQQSREACLNEARNAQADKRRGALDTPGARFDANAAARCSPFQGAEAAACRARVMGYGTATGSVAGGGVLREVETVVAPAQGGVFEVDAMTPRPVLLVPVK